MSSYAIEGHDKNVDINLGYDERLNAFWLSIQDLARSEAEDEDFYLFHNLNDQPGGRMSLPLVESTLVKFAIGLPRDLAEALISDAEQNNYLKTIRHAGLVDEAKRHEEFIQRVRSPEWKPLAKLPSNWF